MENLEQQKKIIELGKLFVTELDLDTSVDTFSRWMAHYLAEKIVIAESTTGIEKINSEKECFNVILELWKHRHFLPRNQRPFFDFEPILNTLSQLNPSREEVYFYNRERDFQEMDLDNLDKNLIKNWMSVIKKVDKVARIYIDFALKNAVEIAENGTTKKWLENAIDTGDNDDVKIISVLLDKNFSIHNVNHNINDFAKKSEIERLQKQISELEEFSKLNNVVLADYKTQLEGLLKIK